MIHVIHSKTEFNKHFFKDKALRAFVMVGSPLKTCLGIARRQLNGSFVDTRQ